ncbi:2-oxoacid:acceptor oxidoreductase family protein [Desulfatitalea alkaliphila]|uniref:2-oxoacid:acceptor oxidoreductase family protein n=1 Tax=Desulfatitalea alkaliphila TaxID=2929485 RepID=A0AA41UKB1_9BACT|nr:2-oxoacid:acceptor oxidoreductase family protein [Desulfatitalea alkaliphila]MCJ8502860.1 2-oxoacid:acceptor oxidoreductase family protein [Desulfatitalea alkaliphila]
MGRTRLVFSGSGGQGVITAAIVLAEAAVLHEGLIAVQTQAYGAAARGSATRADVIISDSPINYPMVVQPNIVVCLTQESYNLYAPIIRPGGLLLTDPRYVHTERKVDAVQREVAMHAAVMEKIGATVVYNICMLGTLLGLNPLVRVESILSVLEARMPKRFLEMNREALLLGQSLVAS